MGSRIHRLGWVVAAALLSASCQVTPATTGATKPRKPAAARPIPAAKPVSLVPQGSPDELEEAAPLPSVPPQAVLPPVAVPSPSAAPAPVTSEPPTPAAPGPLPAAETLLATRLSDKLLSIAQVTFAQNRGQLATSQAVLGGTATAVGLIANNAGGLIANNGGGLIANNGGGLIANNGGGLVSNNGGGLIGNNAGGYRVLQVPAASDPVAIEPLTGETTLADRQWTDGRRSLLFVKNVENSDDAFRRVELEPEGRIQHERRFETLTKWEGGAVRRATEVQRDYYPSGLLRSLLAYDVDKTPTNETTRIAFHAAPTSYIREPDTNVSLAIKAFTVDADAGTGTFEYLYEHLGATEQGTLANVKLDALGQIVVTYDDPLGYYDGESTLRNSLGEVVYTKAQRREGGRRVRTYDLQDGLLAELTETDRGDWSGEVREAGKAVASLTMTSRVDGSVIFRLTFPEAADKPVELGYGVTDPDAPAPQPATPPVRPTVATLAGALTPGYVDGTGEEARFNTLVDICSSQRDPRLYYLADFGNARIRTLRINDDGTFTFGTLAGGDDQVSTDGPLEAARFAGPTGLVTVPAPGGGERLYVSDQVTGAIREVALDAVGSGTVTTIAGAGEPGAPEAPAPSPFAGPWGLAYDAATQRLLVAEVLGHRVRAIQLDDPAHPVTTLIGSAKGFADGSPDAALLDRPFALAIDASRKLYVADGNNRRLRRLDLAAAAPTLETVAGSGEFLAGMIDGPGLTAGLNPPKALAVDPAGHVLTSNFDVRVYTPATDRVRTLAGGLLAGTVDGRADIALFQQVNGIAVGPGGTLLVTDLHRVRLIMHPARDGVLIP
ncbi:MAG: hypothetical protein VKQ33_09185 [Candidatus Sericytochromatia bacterium]|nr:hypothetical protein [Candidatus Sericytochromatia bacterium]